MQYRIAYSYIRFSDPSQAKGNSLKRQTERAQALAKQYGCTLDTTLNIKDLGRSAFRKGSQIGLAAFLRAIEEGKVEAGSLLIVENLDRLSRQLVDDAYQLFRRIILAGVDIAVENRGKVYTKASLNSPWELMEVITAFALANEESEKKSNRTKDNWKRLRQRSSKGKSLISKRCPAWLNVVGGKYVADPKKSAVIRQIFQWSLNGLGAHQILKRLTEKGIPNIAQGTKKNCKAAWNQRAVEHLLSNPQVYGLRQHYRMEGKKRVPEGSAKIEFPAVIDETTFHAVAAARHSRLSQRGPRGEMVSNLFQGIIFDANTGESMRVANSSKQDKKRGIMRRLASYHASDSKTHNSWALCDFEKWFLKAMKEITAEQLTKRSTVADPIPGIKLQLAKVNEQIEAAQEYTEGKEIGAIVGLLTKLDAKRVELEEQLASAKRHQQKRKATEADNVASTLELLENALESERESLRDKLKALLRLMVSEIWVAIADVGDNRLNKTLNCQILFQDGRRREFSLFSMRGTTKLFLNAPINKGKIDLEPYKVASETDEKLAVALTNLEKVFAKVGKADWCLASRS